MLVVDHHDLMRAGLVALVGAEPGLTVVGEASDGPGAVAQAARTRPDVILMEPALPGFDGARACERILSAAARARAARPRVLVLASSDADEQVGRAIGAGASGVLCKDVAPDRLLRALHVLAAGDCLFAPGVARRLVAGGRPRPGTTCVGTDAPAAPGASGEDAARGMDALTPRERQVLALVATGATNEEMAALLTVTEATVKSHLSRAMTKLGLVSRAQAVVLAYESGLVVPHRCRTGRGTPPVPVRHPGHGTRVT
ncbi:response regulator [Streptomyces longwoodensis]|uniref:response regulator n=1 Tax=Streptomyces longwoodensis TaxID=68231 RepID=UPI00370301EB